MTEDSSKNNNMASDKHQLFFQLYTKNQSHIYSYILMLISRINEADDILQEVASSMWEHFDDYKIGTDFASWGVRIARNKVIDYIRKSKSNRVRYSEETIRLISDYQAKRKNRKDQRISALENCVSKLSINDKRLIQLKYNQKITTKALSERIGRSVNGLYKALSRIHYILYRCIQKTLVADE